MRIDLHAHTTASDGLLTATALVRLARQAGVGILAVCDHDSTGAVDEAIAAGRDEGVEVLPAVEINTDVERAEVHVLGYFIDHHVRWFQEFLRRLREGRLRRAERMVEKLAALGVPIRLERVLALAEGGAVGRPHVARALLEAGHVQDTAEAFNRYIGRNGPAYVERIKLSPAEAIEIIHHAGGVPVLAHPGWIGDDVTVDALAGQGLEGIEAYYPDHSPAMVEHYLRMADRLGLLVTGGTDFHGGDMTTRVPLGWQYVPPEVVPRLRQRAEGRQARDQAPAIQVASE